MRRFVLVFAAMLIGFSAFAQYAEEIQPAQDATEIQPGMKYKELKKYYSYKDYTKGPILDHSPAGIGVASCLIPGLGEMICGEGWRGTAFLGGWLASHVITLVGIAELNDTIYWTGITGAVAMRVVSCVDATRIAKVKNMYKRDLEGAYSYEVDLYPSVNYIKTAGGIQPTTGLTLALRY